MYKVLLVDDEDLIRESLIKTIDWQKLNAEVIGEASNGKQALEAIRQNVPDIVISDIRMPIMDGLELSQLLQSDFPDIHTVIISGYDEFAYAQQAIKTGVEDYILKPIRNQNVEESLQRIIKKIELRNGNLSGKQLAFAYQNDIIVRDALLNNVIRGVKTISGYSNVDWLNRYNLSFGRQWTIIVVCIIDDFESLIQEKGPEHAELMLYCVTNFSNEIFCEEFGEAFVFKSQFNEVCAIITTGISSQEIYPERDMEARIFACIQKLVNSVEEYLNITISIGIGPSFTSGELLPESYIQTLKALTCRTSLKQAVCQYSKMSNSPQYADIVQKAKQYISGNLDRDLSLLEVSQHVNLSANYFSSLFHKITGINLINYIKSEKMEKAKYYLLTTNIKISEIARLVGYSDPKYFSTIFKKHFHIAPSDLRSHGEEPVTQ